MKVREVRVDNLSFEKVIAVARWGARTSMSPEARERVNAFREHVEYIANREEAVYGVTTGFGALATSRIPLEERRELQHAILRSHAAGMGRSWRLRSCGR